MERERLIAIWLLGVMACICFIWGTFETGALFLIVELFLLGIGDRT